MSTSPPLPRKRLLPHLPAAVTFGAGLAGLWLLAGLTFIALDVGRDIAFAEEAGRDALCFGFLGNSAAALAILFRLGLRDANQKKTDGLYLAGAFWNVAALGVLVAQAIVGKPWLISSMPVIVSVPLGVGALCSIAAAGYGSPTKVVGKDFSAPLPQRAEIDASCRQVVVLWYASAVGWLLLGSLLAMLASIKLHSPYFFTGAAWLTFGRVRPAHLNAMAYGWASMAGIGTLIWLQARLARTFLPFREALYLCALYWNAALAYGIWSILAGHSASVEWLELPVYSAIALGGAFIVLFVASLKILTERHTEQLYVSQWYLFGAVFWFPFLYITATVLIFAVPLSGTVKAVANWWFAHNVLGLWLTPIGLATAYYLIPKVLGRPIHSYYLSILGFWTVALFYNWAGSHHLIGGPVPAWIVSVGIVGSMMMFIPVITVAINHHMTMVGNFKRLRSSPTLRFAVYGAMSYTLVSIQGSLTALRTINRITHFTHYTVAHAHLGVYSFYTMMMFGAFYYVMPRLTGREWWSARLISFHFWACALGMLIYFVALTWGGWFQGVQMNSPDTPFMDVVRYTIPFLQWRSVAGSLMTAGHLAFAFLVLQMLRGKGRLMPGPTLFTGGAPPLFRLRRPGRARNEGPE